MSAADHDNASVTTLAVMDNNGTALNTRNHNSPTASTSRSEEKAADQEGGIDVAKAEAAFGDLRRELSRNSSLHRTRTGSRDPEKADNESDFDLLAYLQGARDTRDANGFKHKELGVVWEQFGVTGAGGLKVSYPMPTSEISELS